MAAAKFCKSISNFVGFPVAVLQVELLNSWKARKMFLQSSTIGWVSQLEAFRLEKRLITSDASTLINPSNASTLIINLSMFKDLAIERPSLRAHKPFLMFYTPKFIVPLGVNGRIKTYCFIRVEKENKYCTIILGNYKISSWCIFVC